MHRIHWFFASVPASPRRVLFLAVILSFAGICTCPARIARSFCGFYVAQGDVKLFNRVSKVVVARSGERTVMTMASDFEGDPKEFAVVIPVPVVPQKEQVHIGDPAWVDHLEQYSVPRLVEYTDPNPCPQQAAARHYRGGIQHLEVAASLAPMALKAGIISIQAQYKVDEYEIIILSATEGRGLETWLTTNGYRIPQGAAPVFQSYIKQGMFFFVAKVDVAEMERRGSKFLRPIQVAYESPKFMLPIRLGMANADGPQEMYVFTLTRKGRVEATNYRTVQPLTGLDVPEFVKGEFPVFYRALFDRMHRREKEAAVFQEYAWTVVPSRPTCDPCTAPYLTAEELRSMGAYWIPLPGEQGGPGDAVLTRLHLRYDRAHFPEDLQFQETGDRENWQVRYVIHHPYRGVDECAQMKPYRRTVWERRHIEAANYCRLVGAEMSATRQRMGVDGEWAEPAEMANWWERLWK